MKTFRTSSDFLTYVEDEMIPVKPLCGAEKRFIKCFMLLFINVFLIMASFNFASAEDMKYSASDGLNDRFKILETCRRLFGSHEPLRQDRLPAAIPAGLVALGANAQGYNEYFCQRDSSVMIFIPASEGLMGHGVGKDYSPERTVKVSGFFIDKFEATLGMVNWCLGEIGINSIPMPPGSELYPASYMNLDAIKRIAAHLGKKLPTEAQWERAARGTDGRTYPWGEQRQGASEKWYANLLTGNSLASAGRDGYHTLAPVGSYPGGISPWGCLDMAGNVWEWCRDTWSVDAYSRIDATDPFNSEGLTEINRWFVMRGGAYSHPEVFARTWVRSRSSEFMAPSRSIGFRMVLEEPR
jgi:formylglycine-generating enzyme required for sulfatase activity